MTVRWKRGESSFHDSHCGRFAIVPIYRSTVKPSGYKLRDKKTGKEYWVDKVGEAKQKAYDIDFYERREAAEKVLRGTSDSTG